MFSSTSSLEMSYPRNNVYQQSSSWGSILQIHFKTICILSHNIQFQQSLHCDVQLDHLRVSTEIVHKYCTSLTRLLNMQEPGGDSKFPTLRVNKQEQSETLCHGQILHWGWYTCSQIGVVFSKRSYLLLALKLQLSPAPNCPPCAPTAGVANGWIEGNFDPALTVCEWQHSPLSGGIDDCGGWPRDGRGGYECWFWLGFLWVCLFCLCCHLQDRWQTRVEQLFLRDISCPTNFSPCFVN